MKDLNVAVCCGSVNRLRLKVRLRQLYNWRRWIEKSAPDSRDAGFISERRREDCLRKRESDRHKHLSRDGSLHAHYLACSC